MCQTGIIPGTSPLSLLRPAINPKRIIPINEPLIYTVNKNTLQISGQVEVTIQLRENVFRQLRLEESDPTDEITVAHAYANELNVLLGFFSEQLKEQTNRPFWSNRVEYANALNAYNEILEEIHQ